MSNILSDPTDSQVAHLQEINEKIQKELNKVKAENRKLKHIITLGHISTILAMEGGHSYQIRWNEFGCLKKNLMKSKKLLKN